MMKQFRLLGLHASACFCVLCLFVSEISAQQVLSLDSCHALALQHNKELQIADAALHVAKSRREEIRMNYFPQINLSGAYLHMGKNGQLLDYDGLLGAASILLPDQIKEFTTIKLSNIWVANVSLIQPIFAGGKIISANQMAVLGISLKQEMREITRRSVLESVDDAYWQVVQLANKEKLIKQLQLMLTDTQKDVDLLIEQGIATKADGLSIRVKISETDLQLTKVQNGLALSRMLLSKRCGLQPETTIRTVDETLDSIDLDIQAPPLADKLTVTTAMTNRPELRSLRLIEEIYKKKTQIATADMLPTAALVAGYTLSKPSIFEASRDKFGGTYSVGMVVRVPIMGILSGTFRRAEAKSEEIMQTLRRQDAEEMISLEIHQAILSNVEAHKQLTAAKTNKDRAEENLRYADIGYTEGVIPIINLTQAQTVWTQAQDQYIEAQIAIRLSEGKLNRVLAK